MLEGSYELLENFVLVLNEKNTKEYYLPVDFLWSV